MTASADDSLSRKIFKIGNEWKGKPETAVALDSKCPAHSYVCWCVRRGRREGKEGPNIDGERRQLPDGLKEFVLAKPSRSPPARPPAQARCGRWVGGGAEGTDREREGGCGWAGRPRPVGLPARRGSFRSLVSLSPSLFVITHVLPFSLVIWCSRPPHSSHEN